MQLINEYHMPIIPFRSVQCFIQWWLVDNWPLDYLQCRLSSFFHHIN